jgi:hypothetical protein
VDVPALVPAGFGFAPLAFGDTGFGVAAFGADGF